MTCPTEIATILLKLTTLGILRIRAYSNDPARSVIEADHIHNLPEMVRNFSHSALLYYWDVERPSFIEQIESDWLYKPQTAARCFIYNASVDIQ